MAKHKLAIKQISAYSGYGTLRDGDGLMLRDGRWVLRIQVAGRRRDIGLGGLGVVGLKEARRKANEAREAARRGIRPTLLHDLRAGLVEILEGQETDALKR
jgi:hypothetical protein